REAKAALDFGTIADLYLKRAAGAQRPKTIAERARHLGRDWRPFRTRSIYDIGRQDVAGRPPPIPDAHRPTASNRARATLSAFYAWAISHGMADANPVIGTARVGVERSRDRVLSTDEIADIWRAAGEDDHARILKLLFLTGQRRAEVAGLRWSE